MHVPRIIAFVPCLRFNEVDVLILIRAKSKAMAMMDTVKADRRKLVLESSRGGGECEKKI
jgi:hypothetical protein